MTQTKNDIVTLAMQRIGVVSIGSAPSAAEYQDGVTALDAVLGEMVATQGLTMPVDIDATPDALGVALAALTAVDLSVPYEVAAPMLRSRAIMAIRSNLLTDDRTDRRDTDSDGAISEAEAYAGKQAAYF